MRLQLFFFATLLLFSFGVKSQNAINGKILDSLTHEPMPFVNVYFANTTIGTVTDENGEFAIKGFASGKYVLTVSFVGYNTTQLPINFSNNQINIVINLIEHAIQLKEVYVKADSSDWNENFKMFKDNFLGRTRNASKVVITNPKNLHLFFDKEDRVFVAYAKLPIEIENNALGYKIFYQLIDFQIDFKKDKMIYRGIPRFEMLEPKGPRELSRWEEERKRAYYGSFDHFIESLKQNNLAANGFEVYSMSRVPDPDRLADDKPRYIEKLGSRIKDAQELFVPGEKDLITYKGAIQVIFKKEGEENNYTLQPESQQRSIINFLGKIEIYKNGYYEDVRDVFFEGYMGWSEKLAELLPQGYVPEEAIKPK